MIRTRGIVTREVALKEKTLEMSGAMREGRPRSAPAMDVIGVGASPMSAKSINSGSVDSDVFFY